MKPLHLLVTDDDPEKRFFLSRAVGREFPHASIFECHSGQEALNYIDANHVDAVITNHNMFPVNGIELVTRLRAAGVKIPIIMVSAFDEMKAEAEAAGVDLFLTTKKISQIGKPIADCLHAHGLTDRTEGSRPAAKASPSRVH